MDNQPTDPTQRSSPWWSETGGFFGAHYLQGDRSIEGHLAALSLTQPQRTSREVDGVMRLVGIAPGQKVLDVPCGAGRHSIELAARGVEVVGVDLNRVHLAAARAEAARRGVDVAFEEGDMRALDRQAEFDAVINMFYSFGFFDTDAENLRVLAEFRAALRPGGRMLMHTDVNLARVRSGQYRLQECRRLDGGGTLHIAEHYDAATKRIEGAWTVVRAGEATSRDYSVRVYETAEFIGMCLEAGFDTCVAYGDWAGSPCSDVSEEIVFVAR